jgi:hypothetical protein
MADPHVKEKDFQKSVIDLAQMLGWKVAHFRAARTKHGWATPVAADGAGFPDLCMMRAERTVFMELKASGIRKVRPEQEDWHIVIRRTLCEMYVFNPLDTDQILEVLR